MRSLSRQERARRIRALLDEERGAAGPAEGIREGIGARVETTLGADVSNAQVLERQIVRSARASLSLVPRMAKPALASLLVYTPIALASLGAVTAVGALAFVTLPPEAREHLLQTMHFSGGRRLHIPEVAPVVAPAPAVAVPEEEPVVVPAGPPAAAEAPAGFASRHRVSRVVPAAPPVPSRDLSLAEESALLEQARADLLRGAAPGALQTLAIHEARFPAGRMIEQREALAIQALVRAGRRPEAAQRAQRFRERFPGSLMLEVIQSALKGEGP